MDFGIGGRDGEDEPTADSPCMYCKAKFEDAGDKHEKHCPRHLSPDFQRQVSAEEIRAALEEGVELAKEYGKQRKKANAALDPEVRMRNLEIRVAKLEKEMQEMRDDKRMQDEIEDIFDR